jgi:hypothetical protein
MARFFLHIEDGVQRIVDEEGSDLPSLSAARDEALASARELWAAAIIEQRDLSGRKFVVTDEKGRVLATLPFSDALPPGLRRRLVSGAL